MAVNGAEVLDGDGLAMCDYAIGDVTQKFEFIYELVTKYILDVLFITEQMLY